jgi:hypothetical protein
MDPVTAASATERPFDDDDWALLIADIEQRNVVPVVGSGLLIRGADRDHSLAGDLNRELVQRFHLDGGPAYPDRALLEICSRIQDRRKMCDAIRKLLQTSDWPVPEPLAQLAGIAGFDFYVSTTFDSLLFRAVKEARTAAEVRIYGLKRPVEDVAADELPAPVVFQMFGRMDGTGDCALSEEEILQFIQNLLRDDHRPEHIFHLLARRNLLFLGCDFPGWLGRLLRRVLKVSGDLRDSGLFADRGCANDPGYLLFLERQGAKLWLQDNGVDFVAELYRRWRAKHPANEPASVFISYAREDVDLAVKLSGLLEKSGVRVWFDHDHLRSGEVWNDKILEAIQGCAVFIPVISRHSTRTELRFCRQEWELATNMAVKRICPLLTDFTPLPQAFGASHARPLGELDNLVRDVKQFVEGGA